MGLAKNKLEMGRPKKAMRGPGRPRGRGPAVGRGGRPWAGLRGPGRPPRPAAGNGADLVRGLTRMPSDLAAMREALRAISKVASRF